MAQTFGKYLKQKRLEQKLSCEKIASRVNLSVNYIRKLEENAQLTPMQLKIRLLRALGDNTDIVDIIGQWPPKSIVLQPTPQESIELYNSGYWKLEDINND